MFAIVNDDNDDNYDIQKLGESNLEDTGMLGSTFTH
jgi:hypothetical protein